ncbi:MAG: aspartate--tRNA(Asn) ligase [Parcubacteria group bacterium]|nr:aspartate--tRNA(Asn) ligase [Parcubacteria group bacterium]
MERILIEELNARAGETATIQGWVDVRRDQGKLVFFDFRDMSGTVQGVMLPGNDSLMEIAKSIRNEFVVSVTGIVNKRPEKNVQEGKLNGDIELEIKGIEVLSSAETLPFDRDAEVNLDTLLDYRPLTVRRARERAIFSIAHEVIASFREFLNDKNFTEFQAPKIVGPDAEGGAGVFRLDYFKDKSAYLATSPQLYKQLMVGAFERVYATGPQFRAEKHSTTRHLNEISMLDFEMGFIKDHHDVMDMVADLLRAMTKRMGERRAAELTILGMELPLAPETFPSMKLREAQELIFKETGKDMRQEPDLEPEDERWLCEYARMHLNSDFIFITHYPVSKRPFYTMEDPEDPGFTKSFDLLFRGVEILSGSQRVHEYDMLVEKIKSKGLDPEKFSYYLMAFKYGLPPHGGIGMGHERLTQKFAGIENVKEASLFPRDMNRIDTLLSSAVPDDEPDAG